MDAVVTRDLVKIYKGGVKALDGVSISVGEGEIACLLGPNGAGKTTLVRIIATQLLPTSGEAYVFGYNVIDESNKVRELISVSPQEGRVYLTTTPWDEVYFAARIRGFNRGEARRRTEEVLKRLDLWEYRNKKNLELSGGMRQKVYIGRVLVSDARLLILDEPTIGLDPIARRNLWRYIRELKNEGRTILLTTHYMEEAEELADRIYLINHGRILASGSLDEVLSIIGRKYVIQLDYSIRETISDSDLEYICELGVYSVDPNAGRIRVEVEDPDKLLKLVKYAVDRNFTLTIKQPTLEDVFIKLVGREVELYD